MKKDLEHTTLRPEPEWDRLVFSFYGTDWVYQAYGEEGANPVWRQGEMVPFNEVSLSPAAGFLSYGMGIFEGLKAQRARDGRVLIFRPRDNAVRFRHSAERLVMTPFPEEQFLEAIDETVRRNLRFVPPHGKGSFYLRPMQHGIGPQLGIRPATTFWMLVYGCPVGGYFGAGRDDSPTGLRLRVLDQGRCAAGGTGAAKAAGNYAGGLAIARHWKAQGYDDVLFLDARHERFMTETSGANVFVKFPGGSLVTPPLDDQILAGITRDSVLRLARDRFKVPVEERPLPIDEVLDTAEEVFCTGTAYTVQSVRELVHGDRVRRFESRQLQGELLAELLGIQRGDREDPFGWVRELR